MDFTILAVVLLIGVGVPIRNKLIRKYRDKNGIRKRMIAIRSEQYGENRVHPLPSLRE